MSSITVKLVKWLATNKELLMRAVFCIFAVAILLNACSSINKSIGLSDDNMIEEFVEAQIENQTGLDIDLSPSTPE